MSSLQRFVIAAVLTLASVHAAFASGLVTHLEIAHRAAHLYALDAAAPYRDLLAKYPDALYGGAVFPDWGFTPRLEKPGGSYNHDAGEFAHWTPFMRAATAYLRAKPRPWDESSQRLAVFLLGAMCHGLADIYWHNLDCFIADNPRAFLQAMTDADFTSERFHGIDEPMVPCGKTAHEIGDLGGDPIIAYRYGLAWLPEKLYFPIDDLLKIYAAIDAARPPDKRFNVTAGQLQGATAQEVRYCRLMRLADTSPNAKKFVEESLYPYYASWSPWMVEHLEDYHAGALDADAIATALRWPAFMTWFEREPAGTPTNDADIFCPDRPIVATHAPHVTAWPGCGTERAAPAWPAAIRRNTAAAHARTRAGTRADYNYAGSSLAVSRGRRRADFDHDGIDDLVVGIPGRPAGTKPFAGAVRIEFSSGAPSQILESNDVAARFGAAVAVIDWNADGVDDLAVGAPAFGATDYAGKPFRGRVFIYLGDPAIKGVSPTPAAVLDGSDPYANFGTTLLAADCDGDGIDDLVVGSPLARGRGDARRGGAVAVYLSRKSPGTGPDWIAHGFAMNDRFGTSVTLAVLAGGKRRLIVGAPGVKTEEPSPEVGRVYGYDLPQPWTRVTDPAAAFTITGERHYAKLGNALAAGKPIGDDSVQLAIAAPTALDSSHDEAGAVYLVPLAGLQGAHRIEEMAATLSIDGDVRFARLGWQLALNDVTGDGIDDLIVSAPMAVVKGTGVDAGALYVWRGGTTFPRGKTTPKSRTWQANSTARRSQLGHALVVLNERNPASKPSLTAGAPFASPAGVSSGEVVRYSVSP